MPYANLLQRQEAYCDKKKKDSPWLFSTSREKEWVKKANGEKRVFKKYIYKIKNKQTKNKVTKNK